MMTNKEKALVRLLKTGAFLLCLGLADIWGFGWLAFGLRTETNWHQVPAGLTGGIIGGLIILYGVGCLMVYNETKD